MIVALARIRRGGLNRLGALRHPRFATLKRETGGMLTPTVYARLYAAVRGLPDHDVLEIGGASGGASLVIALALRESDKQSKLIVVEKFEGGSRVKAGDYTGNLDAVTHTFERFGVADRITLFPHELTSDNTEQVANLITDATLAALVIDADGRIDRDFRAFWPLLVPGALIVVDDYADRPDLYRPVDEVYPLGGAKMVIAWRLLNQFIEWGLFVPTYRSKTSSTIFGTKPTAADFNRFDADVCERIVTGVLHERDAYLRARTG